MSQPHDRELPAGWQVESVTSQADPRLEWFAHLTDMDLRRIEEPRAGIFMAEGHLVIERAVHLGITPVAVLTEARWLPRLAGVLPRWSGPVYVATPDLLRAITGYRVHRGALAACPRPVSADAAELVAGRGDLVILEDLVDPTNVGLVIRSAAALGFAGAVLSPACGDPLYRRAVKVSMGATMAFPTARCTAWPGALEDPGDRRLLALTPDPTATPLDVALDTIPGNDVPIGLILGTEGTGLSDVVLRTGEPVTIPMRAAPELAALGVDSLNVAAAAAVACYAVSRARRPHA